MISVILRDGRVIQYNDAHFVSRSSGCFIVKEKEQTDNFHAILPMDVVERIDGVKPCRILKESRDKKRMGKY